MGSLLGLILHRYDADANDSPLAKYLKQEKVYTK